MKSEDARNCAEFTSNARIGFALDSASQMP